MLPRTCTAFLIALTVPAAGATQPQHQREQQSFEQRVVAALNEGGSSQAVQRRLDAVEAGADLTNDQRISLEAIRTLVQSKARSKGLRLAEAEAFAARNPGNPAGSMLVAEAALIEDQPQRSADALIAAARGAGPGVHLISPSTVSRLVDKLDELEDKPRILALAASLIDAGWSRGTASLRSYLAMEVIRDAMSASRVEDARKALPTVSQPSQLYAILIDKRLEALRTDVEKLAGPRLASYWRSYLGQARDDWLRDGDYISASAYAAALRQAGYHQTFVDTFLPRFMRGYNCPTDYLSRYLAQDLAESLALLGRWTKSDDVIARAGGVSIGTYAGLLLEKGEFGHAVSYFDRVLKSSKSPEDQRDRKALAWIRAARDCAYYQSRKSQPETKYDPKLLDVAARLRVSLCLDRFEEARAFLLSALQDEEERAAALRWMQPYAEPPSVSAFHKEMASRIRALQHEPAVVEAALRYGIILDWPVEAAAPPESEFKGLPVRRWSPCNTGWTEDPMIPELREAQDLYEKKPRM
jgi:hypothetical protein